MSSNTKAFEEKMKSSVEHLDRELAAVRAGRANPAWQRKLPSWARRPRWPCAMSAVTLWTRPRP